jgi:hypothetical protein
MPGDLRGLYSRFVIEEVKASTTEPFAPPWSMPVAATGRSRSAQLALSDVSSYASPELADDHRPGALARSRPPGHHQHMPKVACQVVRWVAGEPQPGLVEAQLTDSDGRLWSFIDKEPIFCSEWIGPRPTFPVDAAIRCQVIGHEILADGREVITIDTGSPDGVDSAGTMIFRVPASAVSD